MNATCNGTIFGDPAPWGLGEGPRSCPGVGLGGTMGVGGGGGGSKKFFPKIQPDLVCESLT